MSCDLNKLFKFYRNQSNPAEAERLKTYDPAGRLVYAYLTVDQAYKDSLAEYKALGVSAELSIDPARSSALESIMTSALADRTKYLAALESVVLAVGDYPEPTKRYFESLIVGMRRGRGSSQDIAAIQGIIDGLDAIATDAFA